MLGRLNSRFSIGTRIAAGFAMVLLLLAGVAAAAMFGLAGALKSFETYAAESADSGKLAQSDRDFVAMRLNVQFFIAKSDEKALARARELAKAVRAGYADVLANVNSEAQREETRKVISQTDQYLAAIDAVAANQIARDRLVAETTIPLGNKLTGELKELIQSADKANDPALAARAGSVIEQFLSGRVFGLLHNQNYNPKLEEAARAQFTAMGASLKALSTTAASPEQRQMIQRIGTSATSYMTAWDSTMKLLGENNRLLEAENKISNDMIASRTALRKG